MTVVAAFHHGLSRLWRSDRTLTAAAWLMLGALAVFLVGLAVDPRVITGAPAWLKPAKFAISTAVYMFTLAWVFTYLSEWPRLRRLVGRGSAGIFILEVAIIALQAWRGTTSHFNVSTPFNATLFAVMGSAIVVQTLLSALVALAVWRQQFDDRALGWALRIGMVITIAGAALGGLMTRPTEAQLQQIATARAVSIVGAHTVGAADGGRGLPGTGWSMEHGDLRVPHFIGLHALQVLPVIAILLWRRRIEDARRVRLMLVAGGSYAAILSILIWQALRGQALIAPDAFTLAALVLWIALTVGLVVWPFRARSTTPDGDPTLNWINP
jgi:hypothetical protein